MASNYTTNYGLCQWEPGDNFLREEFNQDNAKIDEAIHHVANQLEPMNYNIYYLALQHYYDGKTNLPKKALLFDGFLDAEQAESWDLGLELDTTDGVLRVPTKGESDSSRGVTGTLTNVESVVTATPTWVTTGSGHLTGLTFYFTGTLKIELLEDGVTDPLASGTFTGTGPGATFCPLEADVGAGRSYRFRLSNPDGTPVTFYYGNDPGGSTTWLVFTRHVTPTPATKASLTTTQVQLGSSGHKKALAWVRYQGGSVTIELNDGTGWRNMTSEGSRSTVNQDGKSCKEITFSLDGVTGSGLQVRLTLTRTAQGTCTVYDNGVVFL